MGKHSLERLAVFRLGQPVYFLGHQLVHVQEPAAVPRVDADRGVAVMTPPCRAIELFHRFHGDSELEAVQGIPARQPRFQVRRAASRTSGTRWRRSCRRRFPEPPSRTGTRRAGAFP